MTERLHVGTRKGLFELARSNGAWEIVDVRFLGDPVSAVLAEADGSLYAALDLGTNNCRLLVARPTADGFRVVDAFSRIIRLGEGATKGAGNI